VVDGDTRIDVKVGGVSRSVKGGAGLALVDHLVWEIDKEPGKRGCLIELDVPDLHVNFVPTHDFCEKFIDYMLKAEVGNDLYEFKEGVMGAHRPTEIFDKIGRIRERLNRWEAEAYRAGLKPSTTVPTRRGLSTPPPDTISPEDYRLLYEHALRQAVKMAEETERVRAQRYRLEQQVEWMRSHLTPEGKALLEGLEKLP